MRPTIRQVAERAQVSRMTVSRVLQGRKDQVSPETYQRVQAVLHDMNYVPVRPVMQNRHIETNTIALVPYYRIPAPNLIDSLTCDGVCEQASLNNYDLFIIMRGEAEWMANREELRFLDRRSDGLIFVSPGCGEWQTALETLVEHEIPTVVCYRRDVPEGVAWVDPDNESIMRQALDCLTRAGHKRIVYMPGPQPSLQEEEKLANLSGARPNYDNLERHRYFSEIMGELGLSESGEHTIWIQDPQWRLAREEFEGVLQSGVTAVVCGDLLAFQMLDHAKALGVSIPDELSIVGIDDQMEARFRGLTSVGFGYDEVGRRAVQAWLKLRAGASAEECCQSVPVQLRERTTVGPPRSR